MSFQDVRDQMTEDEQQKTVLLGTGGFSADGRFLLGVRLRHPARLCREFVAANEAVGNVHHGCVDDADGFHVATYDNLTPEGAWRYNAMSAAAQT
jgi:hypothetical protein